MNDRDRLAADLASLRPMDKEVTQYDMAAADRLLALGWTRQPPKEPPMTDEEYAAAIAAMLCPACDKGEHWNHREADGSCRSVDELHDHHCPCPFRP